MISLSCLTQHRRLKINTYIYFNKYIYFPTPRKRKNPKCFFFFPRFYFFYLPFIENPTGSPIICIIFSSSVSSLLFSVFGLVGTPDFLGERDRDLTQIIHIIVSKNFYMQIMYIYFQIACIIYILRSHTICSIDRIDNVSNRRKIVTKLRNFKFRFDILILCSYLV